MIRFCPHCGAACAERIPEGDDRPRAVCMSCGRVHYQNPNAVVGCIVEAPGGLLLCRRAIEPAHGRWTFPAGFLENGESLSAGAARETWEEAQARVEVLAPHALLDIPHIAQTYVVFRARLEGDAFGAGPESLQVEVVPPERIPWAELAFPSVAHALRLWVEDRDRGVRRVHQGVVRWSGAGSRFDLEEYRLEAHRANSLAE